jgi:hypothetical protein
MHVSADHISIYGSASRRVNGNLRVSKTHEKRRQGMPRDGHREVHTNSDHTVLTAYSEPEPEQAVFAPTLGPKIDR